ncbi:hypothetical protein G6011_07315 [Alternaria panax]|uniref:Uncharacterized protein n=1 Tax=Alternaria panax TaxID=48097 RepID=A0AAD4I4M3_9PLEO|nr:hypothetical protein G6011_07315 [Alternaria panax]
MGSPALTSQEHLGLLRSSAFESEHAWLYDNSYSQHEAAALALEQEIEQSYASISPDDNSDEQVRIIKTQINIHRERQRALRPHLESGSDQIDEEGNECVFVPAPNQWGANGDLDEESESLSAIHNLLTWQTSYSPVSHAPHDELPSLDIPYHSLLDPTQPTTTYNLHRTREWTGSSGFRKYIYSARDYSNKYALYMLEATHRDDSQVNAAEFFRVAEFPQPCISILLSGIDKKHMASKDAAYKSRCIHLRGPFSQAIKEYPDRQQKIPWSPRRFTYGGRRFVWRQGDLNNDVMPETLYEYQQDWVKPGSRTGKRCDDAKPIKLVWGEKRRKGKVDSYTIHFRGGMDQVFREILLASQMARQSNVHRLLRGLPALLHPLHRLKVPRGAKSLVMSSTRNNTLRESTHSFGRALISPCPPSDLLSQYFSNAPKITEHGPEWSRSRLPFLAKTFSGKDGCEEYFKVMTNILEMSLPNDAFPGREGFIVDAEAGMVSVVGNGRFTSKKTGKGWDEQFIYRFSEFDEQGKIGHWEVWADPLSAWEAVGE